MVTAVISIELIYQMKRFQLSSKTTRFIDVILVAGASLPIIS